MEIILRNSAEISAVIPVKKIMESNPSILQNISTDKETAERVARSVPSMLLTVTNQGTLATDAGLDYSNNQPGTASLLPKDPSSSAERIRHEISKIVGVNVAVVITDTEIAFTNFSGSTEVAIGYSGIRPVAQMFGSKDRFGREKFGGADIIVDELACAAALLAGQTSEGIPVVIVKGLKYPKEEGIERPPNHGEALRKGLRWTLLSTVKLRFLALVELFV